MSQDIRDFVTPSCDLLALGEPTHREPAFAWVRNELFVQLVERGFRSIALETDRVAALTVNDFVQEGIGTLDAVMTEGFSHGFGQLDANRHLVAWKREYNQNRRPTERLTFHGFDAPMETTSAPSPRRYLEHARDYLKRDLALATDADLALALDLDVDFASLLGDDERWSRQEAVWRAAMSVGATPEAEKLRSLADDMLTSLYARAPQLIASTSLAEWRRAKTHLTAGLGLLRYHKQASQRIEEAARISRLGATRDALMAQNLLDIRAVEAHRGPTLLFAHNVHLQPTLITMPMADMVTNWYGAGDIMKSLSDEHYTFVAGSLGRNETFGLREPEPDTYEGFLQRRITPWGLTTTTTFPSSARTRTDPTPEQGYFPLDEATLVGADAILHINDGPTIATP